MGNFELQNTNGLFGSLFVSGSLVLSYVDYAVCGNCLNDNRSVETINMLLLSRVLEKILTDYA